MAKNTVEIILSAKDRASRAVQSAMGTVQTSAGAAMGAIAAGAAAASAALVTLSGVVSSMGINYNAAMEQSAVAWTTLLGTQEEAHAMLKQISDFTKATPFETAEVDMMAKYMHNAGLEGKKLFDELLRVSDVASAFAIPAHEAKEMTRQMSQVRQAGVAYTEDLNILQDRGVPIFKAIAEQMGINAKDVKKMASQGKISADIYIAAFDSIAKGVEGASKSQSDTFNGMLSTLKDNIKIFSGEITEQLFNRLKGALPDVISLIDQLTVSFQKGGWAGIMKEFLPAEVVNFIISSFTLIKENVSAAISTIGAIIATAVEFWKTLFTGDGNIGQSFINIFNAIKSIALPILTDAVSFIKGLLAELKTFWDENGAQIIQAVKNVWSVIASIIEFIAPVILFIIKMLWNNVKGVIEGAFKIIMGIIKVFAGLFTGDFSKMWEGIKQIFFGAIQLVWNLINLLFVGRILGGIKAFISSGIGFFANFGKATVGTFKGMIDDVISWFSYFRQTGSTIWQSFVDVAKNIIQIFKNNVSTNFSAIKDAIINPIRTAKDTVLGFIDKIKSAFTNFPTKIKLPRFSVSNFSLNPADWVKNGLPKLGVNWYDKGGVFYGPQIIGVGEKRPEFVGALEDLEKVVRTSIRKENPQQQSSSRPVQINFHGPVIADKQGLKQLERMLRSIRIEENERLGVDAP